MIPALNPAIRAAVARWPHELQLRFNERAAIREYEGRQERGEAEASAFLEVDAERRRGLADAKTKGRAGSDGAMAG